MPDDRTVRWAQEAAATGRPIVELSGVSLAYPSPSGPVPVLHDIDLEIAANEVIALMAGLEPPSAGSVRVAGLDLAAASEAARTRLRRTALGIVFQSYHLVPAMTAVENAALPLTLAGDRAANARARAVLEAVGLGHRLDHRPSALSGGEQQRVAIARAFVARPRLVLADEPTGNLDQKTGLRIIDLMFAMAREAGAAMVMVTHDPMLAERCDRTIRLDAGRLVR
jgi:putative ABC transport system ATP-binding protein